MAYNSLKRNARWAGRPWLLTSLACLVLLAGCEAPQKNNDEPETSQAAAGTSEGVSQDRSADASAEPSPLAAAKPRGSAASPDDEAALDEMDADALARYIRELAMKGGADPDATQPVGGQGRNAQRPELRKLSEIDVSTQRGTPRQTKLPQATAAPSGRQANETSQGTTVARRANEAKKQEKAGGCGSKAGNRGRLEPPPPHAPQPKYVCKQPRVERRDIWTGERPTFEFVVANEGAGPLEVRLRGG
jgi:hypothetical protein